MSGYCKVQGYGNLQGGGAAPGIQDLSQAPRLGMWGQSSSSTGTSLGMEMGKDQHWAGSWAFGWQGRAVRAC